MSLRDGKGRRPFTAKEVGVSLGMGLYAWRKMERVAHIAAGNTNLVKDLRPALLNQAAEPFLRVKIWQGDLIVVRNHNSTMLEPHAACKDE